jgi:DNA repair ATPase RecN
MDENEESDENDSIPELINTRDDSSFVELYDEIFNEVLENAILDYMQAINLSNLFISSSETFMNTIMNNNRNYEQVLNESFENQPQMERTDHIVEVETFKYSEIKNEIDEINQKSNKLNDELKNKRNEEIDRLKNNETPKDDVEKELFKHGHPKSKRYTDCKQRSVVKARKELLDHYYFAHNVR